MKLDGVTVLDLSLFLPGPAATQLMADHGARVIKVENPAAPEPTRSADAFPWQQGGETVMFRNTQRGKESIALDLKSTAGKKALLALARKVDVVVEAFRPGVAQRLGVDYESLSGENPGLVYCSISAFGQTGPWKDRPAHDTATVAAAGILDVTRSPEGNSGPAIIGVPISGAGCWEHGSDGDWTGFAIRELVFLPVWSPESQSRALDVCQQGDMCESAEGIFGECISVAERQLGRLQARACSV